MKIVYLIEQPLDERNYERFGVTEWLDRGWTLEVWDLTPISYPKVWDTFLRSRGEFRPSTIHFPIVKSSSLRRRLRNREKTDYFVDFTSDNFWSVLAKLALVRSGAVRIIARLGSIPDWGDTLTKSARKQIAGGIAKRLGKVSAKLGSLVSARFAKPGIVIVSGRRSFAEAESLGYSDRVIRAHNFDYDVYMRCAVARKPTQDAAAKPYAVFLDQDLCFHPEYGFDRLTPYVTPERYFPSICRGLRSISESLAVDVKVAAHPRSSYRDADYFDGIPVEYHRTALLVRDATVIVCHSSTSVQLAVLFRKPIIFVTTSELSDSSLGNYVVKFARLLGKEVVNLDATPERSDWRDEMIVNEPLYAAYRSEFIKLDGSRERALWRIVADEFERDAAARWRA